MRHAKENNLPIIVSVFFQKIVESSKESHPLDLRLITS
jgi:hypothetical protein